MRPRGCTLCRVCARECLLSSVNTSQSLLQGDPAWVYEALLQALKSPLWPKHRLMRHHLKVNLEPSGGETGGKAFSIFGANRSSENWVLYGRGTAPASQPDNTLISSELVSVLIMADLCSTCDPAKQLCSCCEETTVRRAASWRMCFMFLCIHL